MNDILTDGVISAGNLINNVIISGVILTSTLVIYRIFGKEKIEIPGVKLEIELNKAWMFLTLFTMGHLLSSVYFYKSIQEVKSNKEINENDKINIWNKMTKTNDGGLIFRAMEKRTFRENIKVPLVGEINIYNINTKDLAGIVSTGLCVLILLAIPEK